MSNTPEPAALVALLKRVASFKCRCADSTCRPCVACEATNALRSLAGAAPVAGEAQPNGVVLIAAERRRQVSAEGWTPEHDAVHQDAELVCAAICYAEAGSGFDLEISRSKRQETPFLWPWETAWWKPSADPVRNLVKAGALIAAEIERLQRAEPAPAPVREPECPRAPCPACVSERGKVDPACGVCLGSGRSPMTSGPSPVSAEPSAIDLEVAARELLDRIGWHTAYDTVEEWTAAHVPAVVAALRRVSSSPSPAPVDPMRAFLANWMLRIGGLTPAIGATVEEMLWAIRVAGRADTVDVEPASPAQAGTEQP